MINFTSNKDRAKQIEHAIDSEENEKKKKKQILTKNIEVKKLKSTRHNLPGSGILQSQKSGDTQSDGYEMRSKIVSEEMRSKKTVKGSDGLQSEKSGDMQSERYESDKILSREIRSKKTLKEKESLCHNGLKIFLK
uniref:Uncharacterized protein n=1 Tax=Oryza nivara TaxID=4536 RepID=A0A0E0HVJ3_ORYNI